MKQLLLVFLALVASAAAHGADYRVGPVPAWVIPVAADPAAPPTGAVRNGAQSLLADNQTRIERRGKTTFSHYASKALDSKGVEEAADIAITFDPTYQTLTLHYLRVIRDQRVVDRLKSATLRVLQRETELEYRIFDGRKTLSVTLDDLRSGDTVEYAYSVSGMNPVFRNTVSGGADLQWGIPVERVFVRLLAPPDRELVIKAHNTRATPRERSIDGLREWTWDLKQVAGLVVEKDAPPDYVPYAYVQWSEFADWKAVVDWALPMYETRQPGAAIARELKAIASKNASPEARLVAVLQQVQREVRYLGVETGASSHAPAAPDLVFQRRFGDCKDKALLVVAMLRALGIEAQVALVNSRTRGAISAYAATPNAFDHVIVRATVGGKHYWLDPTRAPQKGDLAHLDQASFGMALVLDPATRALTPMTIAHNGRKDVHSVFDSRAGLEKPVSYTITTTIRGAAADTLRAQIAARGQEKTELDYLNYYARGYPSIKLAKALVVQDDERSNTLTTRESYTITDFWPRNGARKRLEANVQPSEIGTRFNRPATLNRVAPLRINFPEELAETTEIKLPETWKVKPAKVKVEHAAFEYSHSTEMSDDGLGLTMQDHYRAREPQVLPANMAAYVASLRKADDAVGLSLYRNDRDAPVARRAKFDWRMVGATVLFSSCVLFGLIFQTSSQAHRETNGRLLVAYGYAAFATVILALAHDQGADIATVAGIVIVLLSMRIGTIAAGASEGHLLHTGRKAKPTPAWALWIAWLLIAGNVAYWFIQSALKG